VPSEYHDGPPVAKGFGRAIDETVKRHSAAEPLIVYGALLAPEPIPLFLFVRTRGAFGEDFSLMLAETDLTKP